MGSVAKTLSGLRNDSMGFRVFLHKFVEVPLELPKNIIKNSIRLLSTVYGNLTSYNAMIRLALIRYN